MGFDRILSVFLAIEGLVPFYALYHSSILAHKLNIQQLENKHYFMGNCLPAHSLRELIWSLKIQTQNSHISNSVIRYGALFQGFNIFP